MSARSLSATQSWGTRLQHVRARREAGSPLPGRHGAASPLRRNECLSTADTPSAKAPGALWPGAQDCHDPNSPHSGYAAKPCDRPSLRLAAAGGPCARAPAGRAAPGHGRQAASVQHGRACRRLGRAAGTQRDGQCPAGRCRAKPDARAASGCLGKRSARRRPGRARAGPDAGQPAARMDPAAAPGGGALARSRGPRRTRRAAGRRGHGRDQGLPRQTDCPDAAKPVLGAAGPGPGRLRRRLRLAPGSAGARDPARTSGRQTTRRPPFFPPGLPGSGAGLRGRRAPLPAPGPARTPGRGPAARRQTRAGHGPVAAPAGRAALVDKSPAQAARRDRRPGSRAHAASRPGGRAALHLQQGGRSDQDARRPGPDAGRKRRTRSAGRPG